MNVIQTQIINLVGKVILGSSLWKTAQGLVNSTQLVTELSGAKKREAVLDQLKEMFTDVGLSLLNLAIELGVAYLTLTQPAAGALASGAAKAATNAIQKQIDKDTFIKPVKVI